MEGFKWLYPGLGVKRWLGLMILGILVISVGMTLLLDTAILGKIESRLVLLLTRYSGGHQWLVGVTLILLGVILLGLGMRYALRSLVEVLSPQNSSNLADVVYRTRSLQKGPRIVVVGGGTGLSALLRGLKYYSSNVTAIVTVADDGGSSGRIREELGILPPGDIRNTLVALADTEPLMETLFQYRFDWGEGLAGHSFGNLFIAAMTDITGDFEEAIRAFSKVLAVRGRVIPSTLDTVKLKATYTDESITVGESHIPQLGKKIRRVELEPNPVYALPDALEAIKQADVIVFGPGSLYTSIIPNILVEPLVDAFATTDALRVYVCNVMTQPGETDGMSAADHLEALLAHAKNRPIIDYAIVNNAKVSPTQAQKYQEQNAFPVRADVERLRRMGIKVLDAPLLDETNLVRHDPDLLARTVIDLADHHGHRPRPSRRIKDVRRR